MKDATISVSRALPNANASNTSGVIDTGAEFPASTWRNAFILVTVPPLSDHTDTTKTNTITMQSSAASGSGFANVSPQIQAQLVGVASTGTPQTTYKFPIPPGCLRYIQFVQAVPTGGGIGSNAIVTYEPVV